MKTIQHPYRNFWLWLKLGRVSEKTEKPSVTGIPKRNPQRRTHHRHTAFLELP